MHPSLDLCVCVCVCVWGGGGWEGEGEHIGTYYYYWSMLNRSTHQLTKEGYRGNHPLKLQLECSGGVVTVVVVDKRPFWPVTARLGVRVQLHISSLHRGGRG